MILEHEDVLERPTLGGDPVRVEAVEPGHGDDAQPDTGFSQELGREQGLVQHHRPVGEQHGVAAVP